MRALLELLEAAPCTQVLVVGDAVLDGWLSGPSARLSREAPVPVVDVRTEEHAAGGAANTAVNLAALGARVRFLSVVGDDDDGERLCRVLRAAGVATDDVLVEPGRRTCAKRRISAGGQMVTRFDTGDTGPVSPASAAALAARMQRHGAASGAVVVSASGLGVLADGAVPAVAALRHPCLVVDSRTALRWAPADSSAASAGSSRRRRTWPASRRRSVSTHPFTPFCTAVDISVVASPTTGRPSAIASQTASPMLV